MLIEKLVELFFQESFNELANRVNVVYWAVAVYVSLILFLFDERDNPGNFQLIWVFATADDIVEEVEDC